MQTFEDVHPLLNDIPSLRRRFFEDGFVFIGGLLPAEDVLRLRRDVLAALDRCGWLAAGSDETSPRPTTQARREGDPEFWGLYADVQRLQSFHEFAYRPELLGVARALIDDEVLVHPRKIARMMLPHDAEFTTQPHQDYRPVQGSADTLTIWLPLGDCPLELGGLRTLAGSPSDGLLPIRAGSGVSGSTVDVADDDERWRAGAYRAGDVIVFHSLTVHAALPNRTDALRLSVDYRYQSATDPVDRGSLLPHSYPLIPAWEELTRDWSATESVNYPETVSVSAMFDPFDNSAPTPPAKLVAVRGSDRDG